MLESLVIVGLVVLAFVGFINGVWELTQDLLNLRKAKT